MRLPVLGIRMGLRFKLTIFGGIKLYVRLTWKAR